MRASRRRSRPRARWRGRCCAGARRGAASASRCRTARRASTSTGTRRRRSSRRSPRRCCLSSASTSATRRRRTRSASCAATLSRERARRSRRSSAAPRTRSVARVVFCGCGSEADNLALRGVVLAEHARRRGARGDAALPHVICTNIEHPAVTACLRALESEGLASFTPVPVDGDGRRACRGRGRCHAGDGARDDHALEQRGRLRAAASRHLERRSRGRRRRPRARARSSSTPTPLSRSAKSPSKRPSSRSTSSPSSATSLEPPRAAPRCSCAPASNSSPSSTEAGRSTACARAPSASRSASRWAPPLRSSRPSSLRSPRTCSRSRAHLYSLLARGLGEQNVRVNGPARRALDIEGAGAAAGLSDSLPNTLSIGRAGSRPRACSRRSTTASRRPRRPRATRLTSPSRAYPSCCGRSASRSSLRSGRPVSPSGGTRRAPISSARPAILGAAKAPQEAGGGSLNRAWTGGGIVKLVEAQRYGRAPPPRARRFRRFGRGGMVGVLRAPARARARSAAGARRARQEKRARTEAAVEGSWDGLAVVGRVDTIRFVRRRRVRCTRAVTKTKIKPTEPPSSRTRERAGAHRSPPRSGERRPCPRSRGQRPRACHLRALSFLSAGSWGGDPIARARLPSHGVAAVQMKN